MSHSYDSYFIIYKLISFYFRRFLTDRSEVTKLTSEAKKYGWISRQGRVSFTCRGINGRTTLGRCIYSSNVVY